MAQCKQFALLTKQVHNNKPAPYIQKVKNFMASNSHIESKLYWVSVGGYKLYRCHDCYEQGTLDHMLKIPCPNRNYTKEESKRCSNGYEKT